MKWIESQYPSRPEEMQELWDRLLGLYSKIVLPSPLVYQVIMKVNLQGFGCTFIHVGQLYGTCNITGAPLGWWGRKFYISPHMTDGEIVQTVFLACKIAMEHELREGFKYKGQAVFDPHYDIEKLVELRASEGALKERAEGVVGP